MKTFISQSIAEKQLCIHCKYCVTTYPTLFAGEPCHSCSLKRNRVDDSPKHTAAFARKNPLICGGRKWALSSDVVVCETDAQAEHMRSEDWINGFIERAKELVAKNESPTVTCGGLDEAIRRVKAGLV